MAMSDDDIKSALSSLISMAKDQADALLGDLVGGAISSINIDDLLQSLGNIRDASDLSGLAEIARLSTEKLEDLTHAEGNDSIGPELLQGTVYWLTTLSEILHSKNNGTSLQSDHAPAPNEFEGLDSQETLYDESSNPVFYALREEIEELAPDIVRLSNSISSSESDSDNLEQSSNKYLELLERIKSTSDLLEMHGLGKICSLLSHNVSAITHLDRNRRSSLSDLLANVPKKIINYLRNPSRDENCVELLAHLSDESWPSPLDSQEARILLQDLLEAQSGEYNQGEELEERPLVATPEDLSLALDEDVNADLVNAFLHEAPQLATEFSDCIAQVVEGRGLRHNLSSAQRLAHTIKGAANLVGLKGIANLTHHLEDVLQYFSNKHLTPSPKIAELLASSADCIEEMIESVQEASPPPENSISLLQSLLDLANQIDRGEEADLVTNETYAVPDTSSSLREEETKENIKTKPGDQATLRIAINEIDEIARLTGELATSIDLIQSEIKEILGRRLMARGLDASMQRRRFELETIVDVRGTASIQKRDYFSTVEQSMFDPLEMDQYDELHGATHSYFESVDDIRELMQWMLKKSNELESLSLQHQQMNKELQQLVLSTRLVAVSAISSRLKRSVRQASRTTNKKVEFTITGDDLKLDSDVLNAITDPIMHILRNAVDHGIESAEEREASEKPPLGRIDLRFSRIGNFVVIECSDDGQGLNYKKIREIAENRGLMDESTHFDNEELSRLILAPGFSTRDKATHISGRGVGMDIVNSSVRSLSGTLDIIDNKPSGTTISIKLPVKMVTHHALLVKSESTPYAIPSDHISQVMTPGTGWYSKDSDELFYWFDDKAYPVKRLSNLLGEPQHLRPQTPETSCYVLLVESVAGTTAIIVDEIEKNIEIAIKNLGDYMPFVRGIAGVSILGQGSIVPVLNLQELLSLPVQEMMGNAYEQLSSERVDPSILPRVLIVDDSFSVRKTLSQIVRDTGYEVDSAKDGIEAIEKIRLQAPEIVVLDLEMPRMNGLELTYLLRDSEDTKDLPIIMLTSRSTQKHRQEAEKAGVSLYMTKPVSDEALLTEIHTLLDRQASAASA